MKLMNKMLKKLFTRLSSPLPLWEGLGVGLLLFVGSTSLLAQDDPFPKVSFRRYQGSMTITAQVVQNGQVVTDAIVAVYCEETIRGKKTVGSGTNPQLAYLTVYGNNTIEQQQLYFKVYTSGIIFTYTPSTAVIFKNNSSIGTDAAPYIITLPVSLADNADNSSVLTTYDTQTCDVVLTGRTLYKDGAWNTLCLPFDLVLDGSPLEGADVRALNSANLTDGKLTLNFTSKGYITELKTGTPYIIKWDSGDNLVSPVFTGVTVSNASNDFTSTDGKVQFKGTYSYRTFNDVDNSILLMTGDNYLRHPGNGATIKPFRAYFEVSKGSDVKEFVLNFGEDDDPDGISLTPETSPERVEWYDLGGCKLSGRPVQNGIYIYNGRKIVIK